MVNVPHEPEQFFQAIFDTVSVGIALVDPHGYVVKANAADADFLGYTPKEMAGMHFSEFTHPDDVQVDDILFQSLVNGERDYYIVDKRYLRKDQSVVWGRLTVSLIRSDRGEIRYIVVVCQDIDRAKRTEQALAASQAQIRTMLSAMTDVVIIADQAGQFQRIHTQSDLYYTPNYRPGNLEDSVLQSIWERFPQETAQQFMDCILTVLETGRPLRLEYSLEIDQQTVWFDASVSRLDARRVIWVARDISDHKHMELALERQQTELSQSEATYRLLFANHPLPLWVYDLGTLVFLEVNDAAIEKYGYTREEFLAMTIADIRPEEDIPALLENIQRVTEGLDLAGIWRHQTKAGKILEVEITSHTLVFKGRRAELVLAHDVTARRQAEAALFHNTLHDALTKLPNRNLLTRRLQALINRGRRQYQLGYAVLFLDLDRFKIINDSLGHIIGDQVLIAVAQKLQSLIRDDDLVTRWGGDEFVIVVQDVNPVQAAVTLAKRLVAAFQTPLPLPDRDVFLGTSIGIVIGTAHYNDPAALLRDADIAMYQAKAQGRNRYAIFDEGMHLRALQQLELEHELRRALRQQELVVHYQPIFSLTAGQPVGLEALVRWQHPQRGLLSPGRFIPIAEETGLITAIDLWVLNEVCRQINHWHHSLQLKQVPRVAVNLSVRDLWNTKLAEDIDRALKTHHIDGQALSLEITESMLVEDLETTTQLLTWFEQRGIHTSIDDFGTGYSSLSYLHSLPVKNLKIDGSFISQMGSSDRHLKIVETIITLGQNLGLKVIAEGIETEDQFSTLCNLGCDRGQGFWFSKPLPAQDIETFMLSH
jgi:diguanylate cyclase (GGDEF)-like protein/PAS domain S-box-containing protein